MSSSLVTRLPATVKLGVPLAAALLAAAACGSSASSSSSSAASGASASPAGAAASATVIKTSTGSAGTFLVSGSGRAVYMFAKDPANQSACSGACASAWPPVTTTGAATASGGAKSSDLGTLTRSDGTKQVTYDGHALYYFAGDSSAGQTNGQGVDGFGAKWWLVAPSGSIITTASGGSGQAPASAPTAAKAGGSWS
jgi:predicted lipoprotein with Yx(FWY)xxD motif